MDLSSLWHKFRFGKGSGVALKYEGQPGMEVGWWTRKPAAHGAGCRKK